LAKNAAKFNKTQEVSIQSSCTILANPFTTPMNEKSKSFAHVKTLRVLKKPCVILKDQKDTKKQHKQHTSQNSKRPCLLQPCACAL
jgi:hypothetical protein